MSHPRARGIIYLSVWSALYLCITVSPEARSPLVSFIEVMVILKIVLRGGLE